jgi:hypothetical protein
MGNAETDLSVTSGFAAGFVSTTLFRLPRQRAFAYDKRFGLSPETNGK